MLFKHNRSTITTLNLSNIMKEFVLLKTKGKNREKNFNEKLKSFQGVLGNYREPVPSSTFI